MSVTVDMFPSVTPVTLRRRSLANLLSMGHCAPTVMRTMLDASLIGSGRDGGIDGTWPVLLVAGLPGGIGNTGGECGGLTAPLVMLGLRYPRSDTVDGLPVAIDQARQYLSQFTAARGTTNCRDIRGRARVPLRCIGVVRTAPQLCAECVAAGDIALEPAERRAFAALYEHWADRGFHCADEVFEHLLTPPPAPPAQLRNAVTAFVGGTALSGMTCSALSAGIMAIGLAVGEIENSRPRVLRMIATMAVGGDAFGDEINAFNRSMNLGHELATWFEDRFGSTQCRTLTGCDFGTDDGVQAYVRRDGSADCQQRCREVAAKGSQIINDVHSAGSRSRALEAE